MQWLPIVNAAGYFLLFSQNSVRLMQDELNAIESASASQKKKVNSLSDANQLLQTLQVIVMLLIFC